MVPPNSQPSQSQNNKTVQVTRQQTQVHFSGPLPHPSILEGYEKILPGSADRIIRMTEEQSSHRRQLETKVIDSDVKNSKLGLWFGLIIGIVALIGATVMVVMGQGIAGSFVALLYIASLVGTFVYGSQRKKIPSKSEEKDRE